MHEEVTIPVLIKYECERGHKPAVAEEGTQMMCQTCVNEFLARNVGLMKPMQEPSAEQGIVPLPQEPTEIEPDAIFPSIDGDGTG
jgi:hypothetical protein